MKKQKQNLIPTTEIIKIQDIIKILESDTYCQDFLFQVNWKALKLNNYPKIIKKQMWLNKVKKNIDLNIYKTSQEIINDIQLIWKNCKTFNKDESVFFI